MAAASLVALAAGPAGATGGPPQINLIGGYTGTKVVTPSTPQVAHLAEISAGYVAFNPANGDQVVASTSGGNGYVYLIAGSSTESTADFGINNAGITGSPTTLTSGTAYLIGGNGAAAIIPDPGSAGADGSASAVATNNPVIPQSVSFDGNGNVVIAGAGTEYGQGSVVGNGSGIQVIAATSGTFYGQAMVAGNLYTIGAQALQGAPAASIDMGSNTVGGYGVTEDAQGNVFVGSSYGTMALNFGTSTMSRYGVTLATHTSKLIAGNPTGSAACTSGANSFPATTPASNSVFFNNVAPYVDSSGNVYLNDNTGGLAGSGCVFVLPAAGGTVFGLSTTAGNVYKLAGNGGTTATSDGVAAVNANIGGTAGVTLDGAGNLVLAAQGGSGTGVSPEVEIVALRSGTYYNVAMTAGDIYTIAGGASATGTTVPGNAAGFQLASPSSITPDGLGNLYLTDGATTSGNLYQITNGPAPVINTTTTLTTSPVGTANAGSPVVLTATVSPSSAPGTVQFFSGGTSLGAASAVSSGVGTLTTSALPHGSDSLTAVFTPTDPTAFVGSTSPAVSFNVTSAATTTTLTASPTGSANSGAPVTLTATLSPSSAVGSVAFSNGGTSLGSAVAVSSGVATLTTSSLPVGSESLSAVFTPTDSTAYGTSTGTLSYTVNACTYLGCGSEIVNETVPSGGVFSLTVSNASTPVTLSSETASQTGSLFVATGTLNPLTINDTRNTVPGWTVSAKDTAFVNGSHIIPGDAFGWTPSVTSAGTTDDAVAGATVAPGTLTTGFADQSQVWASTTAGTTLDLGTAVLAAGVSLNVPANSFPGTYTSTLTITAM